MLRMLCGLLVCGTAVSSAQAAEPLDIVKKAIKANGGKEALTKHNAFTAMGKGTVNTQGMKLEYTATWNFGYPDKMSVKIETEVNGMTFNIHHVYDGKNGWMKVAGMVMKMNDDQLKAVAMQMKVEKINTLVPLLDKKKYTVSSLGEEKVNGKKAIGLNVVGKDGTDVNLYLDPKTYYIVKEVYQTKSEDGKDVSQAVYMSGYKKIKGMPVPHKLDIRQDDKKYVTAEFEKVEIGEKADAKLFKKPE